MLRERLRLPWDGEVLFGFLPLQIPARSGIIGAAFVTIGGIPMKTLYLDCAMGAAGDTRRTIGARFVGRGRNVKKTCLCRHVKKNAGGIFLVSISAAMPL